MHLVFPNFELRKTQAEQWALTFETLILFALIFVPQSFENWNEEEK